MLVSHRIRTDFRSRTTATALKRFSSRKLSLSALLLFAAAGCENRVQNQDELQGLLHDEPLTSIKVSSVMTRTASQAAGRNPVPADGTPDLGTGGNGGDDLATGGNGGSDLATGGNGGSDLATGGNDGGDLATGGNDGGDQLERFGTKLRHRLPRGLAHVHGGPLQSGRRACEGR